MIQEFTINACIDPSADNGVDDGLIIIFRQSWLQ